jgi:uncharacterized protein (TIGR03435 family)
MRLGAIFTVAAVIGMSVAGGARGQDQPSRLTFDVASIRLSKPGQTAGGIKALPGGHGYTSQNIPVKLIISLMYKVPMRQISGGPDWLENDRYDIEARADGVYDLDQLHTMFQNLLADRFKLQFHKDIKEGPAYVLTVDKPGKMTVNDSPQDFNIPMNNGPDGVAIGKRVSMNYFSWYLGQILQADKRPVIDQTGLKGNYDFTLSFAPVLPPDFPRENLPPEIRDRPSIFEALRDQLGLKLTAQKGPVEYYVIDHVERPSEN